MDIQESIINLISKYLDKRDMIILGKKELFDVFEMNKTALDTKDEKYPHKEMNVSTMMDYDPAKNVWTVLYITEQRRSENAEKWEVARQGFKSIDKNLNSALATAQRSAIGLIDSLHSVGKDLFDLEDNV